MKNFLSIDWDFVTGDTSDNSSGVRCCGFCQTPDSPGPFGPVGGRGAEKYLKPHMEDRFELVNSFSIVSGAPVYVAECHASIIDALERFKEQSYIAHLDSHHDEWDENGLTVYCANWVHFARRAGHKVKRYESKDFKIISKKYHGVFICLSSPWTPQSKDREFFKLITHTCYKAKTLPVFIGHRSKILTVRWKIAHRDLVSAIGIG